MSNYKEIYTYENNTWSTTVFQTREEFRDFLIPLFIEPGKYDFDENSLVFNEEGRKVIIAQLLLKQKILYIIGIYKNINVGMV
jgi:hypothetical protein